MSESIDQRKGASKGQYSELPLRIVSAVLLAAFALFCTWMGGQTFLLLSVFLSLLIFIEFASMVRERLPKRVAIVAFLFLVLLFVSFGIGRPLSGLAIVALSSLILFGWEWVVNRSIWGGVALLYAGLPFVALVEMRAGETGLFVILFVFACVWGADTFAYFFGKTFGGPKLALTISPNKTWSGFSGGIIGAIVVSCLLEWYFGYPIGIGAIALAVVLSLASQLGDLFESWIKRRFGHKDSGKIIPGHGGMLDRIDGLIFAIVVAWLIGVTLAEEGFASKVLSKALTDNFFFPANLPL